MSNSVQTEEGVSKTLDVDLNTESILSVIDMASVADQIKDHDKFTPMVQIKTSVTPLAGSYGHKLPQVTSKT